MDNELVFRLDFLLRPVTTKSLVVGRKKGFLAVWPDWAIFDGSCQQICLQKMPKKIGDFWTIHK